MDTAYSQGTTNSQQYLLVYADLMALNDSRNREIADILEQRLKHAWTAARPTHGHGTS
ncbi:type IV toxin-antitoxin system AbiEi family antitoxin [Curvibacter microcysteis]|uniref:type IV toxin-antitoxin system AbiEi family antitoxin n=1 Tax=Curvibacter microcysteis TaxID=3026419 RepID=UPI00390838A5